MLDYSKRKCYGFVKTKSEEFIINESEASNVKLIFECFLNGMSLSEISKELHSKGIASPSGKETWSRKVISSTLSNAKYVIHGIINNKDFEIAQLDKKSRSIVAIPDETEKTISNESKNAKINLVIGKSIVIDKRMWYNIFVKIYLNLIPNYKCTFYAIRYRLLRSILNSKYVLGD